MKMITRTKTKEHPPRMAIGETMIRWTWVMSWLNPTRTGLSVLNQFQKLQMRMTTPREMLMIKFDELINKISPIDIQFLERMVAHNTIMKRY